MSGFRNFVNYRLRLLLHCGVAWPKSRRHLDPSPPTTHNCVEIPTTNSLIDQAGTINGIDYRAIGLTLDKMGLRGMGPKQIIEYVRTGTSTASR